MGDDKPSRWRREDIRVAPGREAFAGLLFAHFDRQAWWDDRELPWRRLSRMVTNSPQNVERWLAGSMPGRTSVRELSHVLNVPARTIQYTLDHNALPADEDAALTAVRARLCTAIGRLDDPDCEILLSVAERMLRDHHS